MKTLLLPILLLLPLIAACGQTSSQNLGGPSALGASPLASSQAVTAPAACFPTAAAPATSSIKPNQNAGGGFEVAFEAAKDGNSDANVVVQRYDSASNVNAWVSYASQRTYTAQPVAQFGAPKTSGTYRVKVQYTGLCEGNWSEWVVFSMDGVGDGHTTAAESVYSRPVRPSRHHEDDDRD